MDQWIEKMDELIRTGKALAVRRELAHLAQERVSRRYVAQVARLAWRAEMPALGIRMLGRIVRPERRAPMVATVAEKAEYAACLTRIGALAEALEILDGLDARPYPRVPLYRAFARIGQWDYAAAIPLIEQYLSSLEITAYDRLVGESNLLAAIVHERRHAAAQALLPKLLRDTDSPAHRLLAGKILELAAEDFLWQRDWKRASEFIDRATARLEHSAELDRFFVRKWAALLEYLRTSASRPAAAGWRAIRKEAVTRKHWETVRQCDYLQAVVTKNERLFLHVYAGTPHPRFRQRLVLDFEKPVELPAEYVWRIEAGKPPTRAGRPGGELDVSRDEALRPGLLLHRLLLSLCSDFYQPQRLAAIHYSLYPREFFHYATSPPRVYDAMTRLRQWARSRSVSLRIDETKGFYRLASDAGISIRLPLRETDPPSDRQTSAEKRLEDTFGTSEFTAAQAAAALDQSGRSARRVINEAKKLGTIEALGGGPAARYRIRRD